MPYMLTFGWVASTGGSTDTHAVSNVSATTLQPLTLDRLHHDEHRQRIVVIDRAAASYTSTITPTLSHRVAPRPRPITVSGTYPTGLVPTAISAGAGCSNCGITGQTFSCTYAVTAGSPIAGGTTLPAVSVTSRSHRRVDEPRTRNIVQAVVSSADALPAAADDYTTVTYGNADLHVDDPDAAARRPVAPLSSSPARTCTASPASRSAPRRGTSFSYDSNTQITAYSPAHARRRRKTVTLTYASRAR